MRLIRGSSAGVDFRKVVAMLVAAATLFPVLSYSRMAAAQVAQDAPVTDEADGDRVPLGEDACPRTPRGGRPIAKGCSATDFVRNPMVVIGPAADGIARMKGELQDKGPYAEAAIQMGQAADTMGVAAAQLGQGSVCNAASTLAGASGVLRDAQAQVSRAVEEQAARLLSDRTHETDDRHEHGDARDVDVTVSMLRLLRARSAGAVGAAAEAHAAAAAACGEVAGPLSMRSKIAEVDDADGLIRLAGGKAVALPASYQSGQIYKDQEVDVSGISFKDGTGLGLSVSSALKTPADKFVSGAKDVAVGKVKLSCLSLRVAPIQSFYSAGPYTQHLPKAYEGAYGSLNLEQGMRFGAAAQSCLPSSSTGVVYTMRIDVAQGNKKETIAWDLEANETPVELPDFVTTNASASVTATVSSKTCKTITVSINDSYTFCTEPVQLSTESYWFFARARGTYSSATYNDKIFSVTDDGVAGDFEPAKVTKVDLTLISSSANATFKAEGYKVSGGVSTRPQVVSVAKGEYFAIYEDDFYKPNGQAQLELTGVDSPSGLRWPRVEGIRNGATFWYSTKLPKIVRDLVTECGDDPATTYADPDGYFRLPFGGGYPTWKVNTGNFDDPVWGHGAGQPYAWDFTAPEYTDIRAARGGTVALVEESEWMNASQYPPNYPGIGNYVWVRHEDGSYAVYFHLVQNGSLVNVGDVVHRGDHIAENGNTGNSSEPHLHWGGFDPDADDDGAFDLNGNGDIVTKDVPSRFEAKVGIEEWYGFVTKWEFRTCYLPRSGDKVWSTN